MKIFFYLISLAIIVVYSSSLLSRCVVEDNIKITTKWPGVCGSVELINTSKNTVSLEAWQVLKTGRYKTGTGTMQSGEVKKFWFNRSPYMIYCIANKQLVPCKEVIKVKECSRKLRASMCPQSSEAYEPLNMNQKD